MSCLPPVTTILCESRICRISCCAPPGPSTAALCLLEFWPMPVPLCRVAHDEAHHASGQHDLEIITVLHLSDDECQEQSDAETKHNAQRQRMHLAGEHPNKDTGDYALNCGPDNNASDLRPRLRREPGGHPVDST